MMRAEKGKMRLRSIKCAALLAAVLGFVVGTPLARGDDASTTMLVVDGSGSMWARLPPDNRAKIDIVREKLASLLATPSSTRLGLVSFGHRRRGDCSDVELIATPDLNRDRVLAPLAKLNPKGPGPLTAALRTAVAAIGKARPAQIVVVGDGADNCQQDSCAVASDFAKTSPGIVIQVIGIGILAAERPRIACFAEATGGHFYDITDSNGLNAALDEATRLAILSPETVAGTNSGSTKISAQQPPAGATLRASAALAKDSALLTAPLKWRILEIGEKTIVGESQGPEITAKLPAGTYDIEAELGPIKAEQQVTIVDGAAQSIVVALGAAHLAVRATEVKGGETLPTAILTVTSGDVAVAIARGGVLDLYLAPADYTVSFADGAASTTKTVTLVAGDDNPLDIALGTGRLEVSAAGADGQAITDVLYTILEDDTESPNGRREVARSRAPQANFTLPEGTYYVSARSGGGDVRKRVAIGAGGTVKETLSLALSPLKVSAVIAGAPAKAEHNVLYRVDRVDGDRARVARAIGPDLALNLPPGKYRVSASLSTFHLSAAKEVVLEAGKPVVATLEIQGGEVTFKPPLDATLSKGDAHWEVLDASGALVWRAVGNEAKALLAPGHYTVRLAARNKHKQAQFDVRSGESQEIEIGPG
jgi:Ca-activated chloride channel family protein